MKTKKTGNSEEQFLLDDLTHRISSEGSHAERTRAALNEMVDMLISDAQGVGEDAFSLDEKAHRANRLGAGAARISHLAAELMLSVGKLQELIAAAQLAEDMTHLHET